MSITKTRPDHVVEIVTIVELEITDEHVENIVHMGAVGIAYWAVSAELDDWDAGDVLAFREVGDGDVNTLHHLTGDIVRQTWAEIAAGDHNDKIADRVVGYFRQAMNTNEPDDIDSEAADVLVQIATLGSLVYG